MACKKCKDKRIDDKFKCHACHVKDKTFVWIVIARADEDDEGNQYDFIYRKGRYLQSCKAPVFELGEIFPADPIFHREITGAGRKPSKWNVTYEVFSAKSYAAALLKSIKLLKSI